MNDTAQIYYCSDWTKKRKEKKKGKEKKGIINHDLALYLVINLRNNKKYFPPRSGI